MTRDTTTFALNTRFDQRSLVLVYGLISLYLFICG